VNGVERSVCRACGWRGFPLRLWCPSCLADGLTTETVLAGAVEDATTLRRAPGRTLAAPVQLGTVLLEGGGRVIARLEGVAPGERARLWTDAGAPVARPWR
jgi:uncharacterized OB-fold protein